MKLAYKTHQLDKLPGLLNLRHSSNLQGTLYMRLDSIDVNNYQLRIRFEMRILRGSSGQEYICKHLFLASTDQSDNNNLRHKAQWEL